ncbi:alpha/beta hydrolase family protein [Fodinicola acaciae]|uniref:alpha/beta hydrolase family protein n=1 Tax=Fodinicola acaciae TaxID=2681555 RepID=UPI0013D554E9|nr:lipase [Fodinicola acaciae]
MLRRVLVVGAVAAAFGGTLATPAVAATTISLPALSGRYPVGTKDIQLVDPSRQDPWNPRQQRELMVTVTYPARNGGERAPWMMPGVAGVIDTVTSGADYLGIPNGSVNWSATRRQARTNALPINKKWPVVLFSPGSASIRELNATLTDDLASHGYVVVSLSHTHESAVVEFPDGRLEYAAPNDGGAEATKKAIDARIADTRFVLDQLPKLGLPVDLGRIGVAGHSFGGYAAGEAMAVDRRIDAGANLDGAMTRGFPPSAGLPENAAKHGLDRPFLLFGADSYDTGGRVEHSHRNPAFDPSWSRFWSHQRAWKRDLHLDRAAHYSFMDFQVIIPQLGSLIAPARKTAFIGQIDPARSLAAQHDYLAGFFDLWLKCRDRGLFWHDSPSHPDAHFVG